MSTNSSIGLLRPTLLMIELIWLGIAWNIIWPAVRLLMVLAIIVLVASMLYSYVASKNLDRWNKALALSLVILLAATPLLVLQCTPGRTQEYFVMRVSNSSGSWELEYRDNPLMWEDGHINRSQPDTIYYYEFWEDWRTNPGLELTAQGYVDWPIAFGSIPRHGDWNFEIDPADPALHIYYQNVTVGTYQVVRNLFDGIIARNLVLPESVVV